MPKIRVLGLYFGNVDTIWSLQLHTDTNSWFLCQCSHSFFFFHFTSVFAARRRNTKNNGSTFRETNSTSGAWLARKSKLNLQFVFAPVACVLSALLPLFYFVLFSFSFNYLGIDNKILDAKFFVRSYNLQHVLFVFLFDSLTSENKCTRTGHEWRTQWRRGWGGGCEHKFETCFQSLL